MKPNIANLFASLIVDQWPLPHWIRNRIQSHPDIADAIASARALESQLGDSAKTSALDQSVLPKFVAAERTLISSRIAIASFATAAVLLICLYGFSRSGEDSRQNTPALAKSETMPSTAAPEIPKTIAEETTLVERTSPADLSNLTSENTEPQAILVSLLATETVFKEISLGLENVAGDLADASVELGSDFKTPKASGGDADVQRNRRSFWLTPVINKL